jgi:hypothetical protein
MQSQKLVGFEIGHSVSLPGLIGKLDQHSRFVISLQKFNNGA